VPAPTRRSRQTRDGDLPLARNSSKLDTMVRLSSALGVLPFNSDSTYCDSTFGSASVLPYKPQPIQIDDVSDDTSGYHSRHGIHACARQRATRGRASELAVEASHTRPEQRLINQTLCRLLRPCEQRVFESAVQRYRT